LRLEEHREKARQISEVRAKVGRSGAASRWQQPPLDLANATGIDGKDIGNRDGKSHSMSMPSKPSHPKPSEEGEHLRSSSVGDLSPSPSERRGNGVDPALKGPRRSRREQDEETPAAIASARAADSKGIAPEIRDVVAPLVSALKSTA
jgi:hypothetical protein